MVNGGKDKQKNQARPQPGSYLLFSWGVMG